MDHERSEESFCHQIGPPYQKLYAHGGISGSKPHVRLLNRSGPTGLTRLTRVKPLISECITGFYQVEFVFLACFAGARPSMDNKGYVQHPHRSVTCSSHGKRMKRVDTFN